jgi:hypothetical protein
VCAWSVVECVRLCVRLVECVRLCVRLLECVRLVGRVPYTHDASAAHTLMTHQRPIHS